MPEALAQVRAAFGADAVILRARQRTKTRLGRPVSDGFEIVAVRDEPGVECQWSDAASQLDDAPAEGPRGGTAEPIAPRLAHQTVEQGSESLLPTRRRDAEKSRQTEIDVETLTPTERRLIERFRDGSLNRALRQVIRLHQSGTLDREDPAEASATETERWDEIEHLVPRPPRAVPAETTRRNGAAAVSAGAAWGELRCYLLELGWPPEQAERLLTRLEMAGEEPGEPHESRLRAALVARLSERLNLARLPSQAIVPLLGPPGSGKTTTAAKLAARARRSGRSVAVISADVVRIGAVRQWHTLAEILGVPLSVATTAEALRAALEHYRDVDLVLIDTAGRLPEDGHRLVRVGLAPLLPHLVIDATLATVSLGRLATRYLPGGETTDPLGCRSIVTRVDLLPEPGPLLGLATQGQWPLAFLGMGPNISSDLEAAEEERVARRLLGYDVKESRNPEMPRGERRVA